MKFNWMQRLNVARGRIVFVLCALTMMLAASARAQDSDGRWRLGASAGAYIPFSSLIKANDSNDTGLAAGPALSLEPQYLASRSVSVYLNALLAVGTIHLGSSIQPDVLGPSDQVVLGGGTVGVMLTAADWFDHIQPTLRLGGGFKWYVFDLAETENQVRPTADVGLGFRGVSLGVLEVMAEVRYLPSSFDQSKLPTRGIAPQDQRQNDLVVSIGFAIRPPVRRGT